MDLPLHVRSLTGKRREMGIGSASLFGLAEAREKAQELARQVKAGTDPIEYRIAQQAAQEAAQQAAMRSPR